MYFFNIKNSIKFKIYSKFKFKHYLIKINLFKIFNKTYYFIQVRTHMPSIFLLNRIFSDRYVCNKINFFIKKKKFSVIKLKFYLQLNLLHLYIAYVYVI